MGKLRDIINSRANGKDVEYRLNVEEVVLPSPVQTEQNEKNSVYYNATWLSKVALHRGYAINPNNAKVEGILGALNRKGGHCPCGGNGEQFMCPCVNMRTLGICKCGLFMNIPDRQIKGATSSGRIE